MRDDKEPVTDLVLAGDNAPAASRKSAAAVYLAGLAPGSRPAMAASLRKVVRIMARLSGVPSKNVPTIEQFNWGALRFEHTSAVRAALAEASSAATVNKDLVALRQVLQVAVDLGQMSAEQCASATRVRNLKGGDDSVAGRAITPAEVQALVDACPRTPEGDRDAAIVMVLACAGLRRAELAALNRAHYDGTHLTFRGKRNKLRRISVKPIAPHVDAWLKRAPAGGDDAPLFCTMAGKRLTVRAVWVILRQVQDKAGIQPVTPHDLRRGFITNLLAAGEDVLTVSKLAGHSSPATTKKYDRRGDEAADAAVEKQMVPKRGVS